MKTRDYAKKVFSQHSLNEIASFITKMVSKKKNIDDIISEVEKMLAILKKEREELSRKNKEAVVCENDRMLLTKKAKVDSRASLREETPSKVKAKLVGYANSMKRKPTDAESKFAEFLDKLKVQYEAQKIVMFEHPLNYKYILDFYIPSKMICVEIDGGYHLKRDNMVYDIKRDSRLRRVGIETLRLTNDDVLMQSGKLIEVLRKLK